MSTTVQIKRGDTARKIRDTLTIDGDPVDLSGTTVKLGFKRDLSATPVFRDAIITAALTGDVEYQLVADDTATAGKFFLEWHVTGFASGALRFPTADYNVLEIVEDIPES